MTFFFSRHVVASLRYGDRATEREHPTYGKAIDDYDDDDDNDDDDDGYDDELCDEVSALGLEEETVAFRSTAGHSVRFAPGVSSGTSSSRTLGRGNNAMKHTVTQLTNVVDVWQDSHLNKRISIQAMLPSGMNPQNHITWRVSTDQKAVVISVAVNTYMLTPEAAFNTVALNQDQVKQDKTGLMRQRYEDVLAIHPKTVARKATIARLKGRESGKALVEEHRIPLPFKCDRSPVSSAVDPLFNGVKLNVYEDNSVHLHIELRGVQVDSYSPMKDEYSIRSGHDKFMGSPPPLAVNNGLDIPVNIVCAGSAAAGGGGAQDDMSISSENFHSPSNETKTSSKKARVGSSSKSVTSISSRSSIGSKRTVTTTGGTGRKNLLGGFLGLVPQQSRALTSPPIASNTGKTGSPLRSSPRKRVTGQSAAQAWNSTFIDGSNEDAAIDCEKFAKSD